MTEEYVPLIPFVSGDFVNEWKSENIESCAPIVEKIKKITASEGGIFVETSDLLSNNQATGNGDNIHFSRESLHILGIRYFDAFSKIIRKKGFDTIVVIGFSAVPIKNTFMNEVK